LRELLKAKAELPKPAQIAVPKLPAQLLNGRPDVAQALLEVAASSAAIGQAHALGLPKLSLNGTLAPAFNRASGDTTRSIGWSFGPSVSLPLYTGGVVTAQTEAARAAHRESIVTYRAAVRRAVSEVETTLTLLDSANAREPGVQIALDGFLRSLKAEEARNRAGLGSLFELEEARRNALAARTAQLALKREQVANWIALYRAVGGGYAGGALDQNSASEKELAVATSVATQPSSVATQQ
jgi:outer membrane protein, multidrug efflux system